MKKTTAPIGNDLSARKVKPPESGYSLHKTTQKRLFVRVSASGARVWECHYRVNGRREKVTLGAVNDLKFDLARAKTLELSQIAKTGTSPRVRIELDKNAEKTVGELLDEFDYRHLSRLGNPETTRGRMNRWIRPMFGSRLLVDVRKGDFVRLANMIEDGGADHEHVRILKLCRQIWQFAVDRGLIESSPVPAMKSTSKPRSRYLSGAEIAQLWKDTDLSGNDRKCPFNSAHTIAWKLVILTGQRITSLLSAEKGHFDLDNGLWIIPASLMKTQDDAGQAHTVHLSPLALSLVREAMAQAKGRYLFTGERNTSKPVSASWFSTKHKAWLKAVGIPTATVHDYRRALATHCADLAIAPHIVEKILAHRMTGVMAVYNRAEYLADRKTALVAYSDWIQGIAAGGNVVPLRTAHRG